MNTYLLFCGRDLILSLVKKYKIHTRGKRREEDLEQEYLQTPVDYTIKIYEQF